MYLYGGKNTANKGLITLLSGAHDARTNGRSEHQYGWLPHGANGRASGKAWRHR